MFILNILFPFKTRRTLMKKQYYIYAIGLKNNDNYMNITGWGVGGVEELLRKLCFRTKKEISRFPSEGTSRPPPLKEI